MLKCTIKHQTANEIQGTFSSGSLLFLWAKKYTFAFLRFARLHRIKWANIHKRLGIGWKPQQTRLHASLSFLVCLFNLMPIFCVFIRFSSFYYLIYSVYVLRRHADHFASSAFISAAMFYGKIDLKLSDLFSL